MRLSFFLEELYVKVGHHTRDGVVSVVDERLRRPGIENVKCAETD